MKRLYPYIIITILYLLITYMGIRYMVSKHPKPDVKFNNADNHHSVR
jgi:hypothetical protein